VTTLRRNKWYHLVGTYDATSNTASVYLNGKLENTVTGGTTPIPVSGIATLGRNGFGSEFFFLVILTKSQFGIAPSSSKKSCNFIFAGRIKLNTKLELVQMLIAQIKILSSVTVGKGVAEII
jgi:hypothetical protein